MEQEFLSLDQYLNKRFLLEHAVNIDEQLIEKHNRAFIARKLVEYQDYFDQMFLGIDDNIILDIEQRIAILTDEDYNLIVAGAGSGKTTTMTAKIKYMIDKCHIPENQILAISFARKNVEELIDRLHNDFHLAVTAMTFHQLGNTILKATSEHAPSPAEDSIKYKVIREYLENTIFQNKKELTSLLSFLGCYFDVDPEIETFESLQDYHAYKTSQLYQTLKGNVDQYNETVIQKRKDYRRSINNEYLRSGEEVTIANFLYLNGIEYHYEKRYSPKYHKVAPYHPDFTIEQGENVAYIEHFGISQNGSSSVYSLKELNHYEHNIRMKQRMHERNRTVLIQTYSKFNDQRPLLEHLTELLNENGFVLKKRSADEIYQKLMSAETDRYFYHYILLLTDFISQFKLNQKTKQELIKMYETCKVDRTKRFLATFYPVFQAYETYLQEHNLIDFDDMIVKSSNKIQTIQTHDLPFQYRYIIIDEYQDISKQRYDLIKNLSDLFDAEIVAVGDDWQSIFAFAGSNVELFSRFVDTMGYGEILKIKNTYRNAQELIDIAGDFVSKDESHIKKTLYSKKHIEKPIVVYSYSDQSEQPNMQKAYAIELAIKDIIACQENARILLLGRYGFDLNHLIKTDLFHLKGETKVESVECPDAFIEFSTVHRAKGLEYDYTIIINAIDSTYGFPSKVKDDPIFQVFDKKKENMAYAEERRLFYVALTRTKNKVYIIVPESKPSPFVLELKENSHVEFKDHVIEHYLSEQQKTKCPNCGSMLKRFYFEETNGYVYRCTNEKELCNFMTTELIYKIPLELCPDCKEGYLMIKRVNENGVLYIGCTNYKEDKSGCNCHYTKRGKSYSKELIS